MSRLVFVAILFQFYLGFSQDSELAEGHSVHGEAFNEGPRQSAVLIPGTGKINFPVATDSTEAQAFFNQGIGQLHGYWDFEAERSFRQAAAIDPELAMAYWGMAQVNFSNQKRAAGFIAKAVELREHASEREQRWIDASVEFFGKPEDVKKTEAKEQTEKQKKEEQKKLRKYLQAHERIVEAYPDDLEAKAFLFKQIYYNHRKGIKISSHYATNLLAEEIIQRDPFHPAHHYIIHIWDQERAENAVKSAARLGNTAPAIAHMWHMPGHIYTKLKRYDDAAFHQEASARVDHQHMIKYQLVPDQIFNFSHNNEWLVRNYNYIGRHDDAVSLAKNMIRLPRLPKFTKDGDASSYDPKKSSWQYGRIRLRDSLILFEQWDELLSLAKTDYLKPDGKVIKTEEFRKYIAIAKFESGDVEGGNAILQKVSTELAQQRNKQKQAGTKAAAKARDDKKSDKQINSAKSAAEKTFAKKIDTLQKLHNELQAYSQVHSGDLEAARATLSKLKNIAKPRLANLWFRAGDDDKAIKIANDAVKAAKNQVLPLAYQVYLLNEAGRLEDAQLAFEELRIVANQADINLPIFQRLQPLAEQLGYPEDWRTPRAPAKDLEARPDLDSLGPAHWSPPLAPDIYLPNADGVNQNAIQPNATATLVIFFLGKGCTHCMEQLNEFVPMVEKYRNAGIEIVAISTDSTSGLAETFANGGDGKNPFPFPLLSDESLDTFKAMRAFDDFEDQPLHGTFLIDTNQRIRWQDISFEPFMYPDWLFDECVRLLNVATD